MKITEYLKDNILILDGGMGTMLQKSGLPTGELPERFNLSHPELIEQIHRDYYNAGSNVVSTNTFGANLLKFSDDELSQIVGAAVKNVRRAKESSTAPQEKWIALDIGPSGRMLAPYGDFDFEDAVALFRRTVELGVENGVDLIFIETMNDSYETKAALLAAKEACDLPVFVSNAYGEDGKLMTGADPAAMVAMLEGMGADAIGMNCSLGPKALRPVAEEYLKYASVPVLLKPNAGMPHVVDGRTVYDVLPDEFSDDVSDLIGKGVRIAGGCCGTTPDYIRALSEKTVGCKPVQIETEKLPCVSSYTHAVFFDKRPVLIGERINPTGKKRFKEALRNREMDYILKEGLAQQEKGVDILDVNVGLPEIDEAAMLTDSVRELQAVTDLPLQIDSSDPAAMEAALRRYNGKAMINSVNGKKESMETIFPLAKKYGGLIVALTLDEGGIPATADGRVAVARKILETARQYGLDRRDLIFDPLAMTVSADQNAARETLHAVERIRKELGCCVSLGVSNVSFGLPRRDLINGAFLTMAMTKGLSAAIMNPYSDEMMKAFYTFNALSGLDDNCGAYIEYVETLPQPIEGAAVTVQKKTETKEYPELQHAIIKGLKDRAAALTVERLQTENPLDIVQNEIIPALDTVGHGFEQKTVYLPQLLMSAEAAKSAFEKIKAAIPQQSAGGKCSVVIATVQGDIHDIGKNIVKLLLENYGFAVTDLGKDVAPETIVEEVVRQRVPLVGLSALMTTTVPAMAETVALLHEKAPWCKTVVGGAVLTEEYAASIHADKYAKDAMETVRYAEEINAIIKKRSNRDEPSFQGNQKEFRLWIYAPADGR